MSEHDDQDLPNFGRFWLLISILLLFVTIFTVSDMIQDLDEHPSTFHMVCESAVAISSLTSFAILLWKLFAVRRHTKALGRKLSAAHADTDKWRREAEGALRGLGAAIDAQFGNWHLSPAEKEIGMLLLKGLALKEIADVRGTSERTVRHQAQEVYRKSNLSGRADFSAFFLEDLLLPLDVAKKAST